MDDCAGSSPYFIDDKIWYKFKKIYEGWLGTPYRHLTMVRGRGADCTLFIGACWLEQGILKEVTYDYYPKDWHIHTKVEFVIDGLHRHFADHCNKGFGIDKLPPDSEKMRGDMLAFATTATGVSNHTSIYLNDGWMIHSINNRGVSYFPFGGFWDRKITAIFRIMKKW